MRQKMELLAYFFHAWDMKEHVFIFGEHLLKVIVEDIYFLTSISRTGAPSLS